MSTDEYLHRIGDLLEQVLAELREDEFFTFAEAADYCGCTSRTIRKWRYRNIVRTVTRGKRKGVMKSDLDKVMRETK